MVCVLSEKKRELNKNKEIWIYIIIDNFHLNIYTIAGAIPGTIGFGYFSDNYGRKEYNNNNINSNEGKK